MGEWFSRTFIRARDPERRVESYAGRRALALCRARKTQAYVRGSCGDVHASRRIRWRTIDREKTFAKKIIDFSFDVC
jgi:hypothetical protein